MFENITEEQINEAIDRLMAWREDNPTVRSKCWGMTYEEGIRDALEWVLGETDEDPTSDHK